MWLPGSKLSLASPGPMLSTSGSAQLEPRGAAAVRLDELAVAGLALSAAITARQAPSLASRLDLCLRSALMRPPSFSLGAGPCEHGDVRGVVAAVLVKPHYWNVIRRDSTGMSSADLLGCHWQTRSHPEGWRLVRFPCLSSCPRPGRQGSPRRARADPRADRQRHRPAPALDLQRRDRQAQPQLCQPAPPGRRTRPLSLRDAGPR